MQKKSKILKKKAKSLKNEQKIKETLSIEQCIDILDTCYFANDHPYPMGLGLLSSIKYLKIFKRNPSCYYSDYYYSKKYQRILNREKKNTQKGFTLIELIITFTIIGILLAIAIPKFQELKEKELNNNTIVNQVSQKKHKYIANDFEKETKGWK